MTIYSEQLLRITKDVLELGALFVLVLLCVWCVRECFAEGGLDVEKRADRKPWRRTRIFGNVLLGIFAGMIIFSIPFFLARAVAGDQYAHTGTAIMFALVGICGWILFLGALIQRIREMILRRRAQAKEERS